MFCYNCGVDLPDDVKFCPNCGTRQVSLVQQTSVTMNGFDQMQSATNAMTARQALSHPNELFFASIVEGYLANPRFVQRNWLADAVAQSLQDASHPFVLLTAEPGFGKSVFMAQLAHEHPYWPRYFIRRDQHEPLADVGSRSFLLRIGYQLATCYPELFTRDALQLAVEQRIGDVRNKGEAVGAEVAKLLASPFHQDVIKVRQHIDKVSGKVVGLRINELVSEPRQIDPVDLQHMALIDPAHALQRSHPERLIVILLDALDEVRYHETRDNLLHWLTNCPDLPDNIRFVLTARPSDGAVKLFMAKQARRTQHLLLDNERNKIFRPHINQDVATYVDKLLDNASLRTQLAKQPNRVDLFRAEAIAKADGNVGLFGTQWRGGSTRQCSKRMSHRYKRC